MATVLERRESMSGDWRRLFHGSVLEAITAALSLRRGGLDAGRLHRLAAAARQADPTSRLLVLHALARGTDDGTQRLLLDALLGSDAGRRAHAAWVLGERSHDPRATGRLTGLAARGGFAAMVAGLTLERWLHPPRPRPRFRPSFGGEVGPGSGSPRCRCRAAWTPSFAAPAPATAAGSRRCS